MSRLDGVTSYALDYGRAPLDQLARYQLVIVEPTARSAAEVRWLRRRGVMVLGYLSLLEAGPHLDYFPRIPPEAFLGQQRVGVLDPRHEGWRRLIMAVARERLHRWGLDGLLLDGLESAETPPPGAGRLRDWCIPAAADLVRRIREALPGAVLVQNQGLWEVAPLAARWLDGLMWENPPLKPPQLAYSWRLAEHLVGIAGRHRLRVFVLVEGDWVRGLGEEEASYFNSLHRLMQRLPGAMLYVCPRRYASGEVAGV